MQHYTRQQWAAVCVRGRVCVCVGGCVCAWVDVDASVRGCGCVCAWVRLSVDVGACVRAYMCPCVGVGPLMVVFRQHNSCCGLQ